MLPPPTWTTLKRLSTLRSVADLLGWAAAARIVRVQPLLIRDAERTMLTLPGDPTFPTIDGWDIPEETRFVLQDGQWLPDLGLTVVVDRLIELFNRPQP